MLGLAVLTIKQAESSRADYSLSLFGAQKKVKSRLWLQIAARKNILNSLSASFPIIPGSRGVAGMKIEKTSRRLSGSKHRRTPSRVKMGWKYKFLCWIMLNLPSPSVFPCKFQCRLQKSLFTMTQHYVQGEQGRTRPRLSSQAASFSHVQRKIYPCCMQILDSFSLVKMALNIE